MNYYGQIIGVFRKKIIYFGDFFKQYGGEFFLEMDSGTLSFLLDAANEAVLTIDDTGRITYCNDSFKRIFGAGSGKSMGADFKSWLNADSEKEFTRILKLLPKGSTENIFFIAQKNGDDDRTHSLRINIRRMNGEHGFALVMEPHEEGEDGCKLYRLLAENVHDINLMLIDEVLSYISPSIQELLGYAVEHIKTIGDWYALIHPDDIDEYLKQFRADEKNKEPLSFYTFRLRAKNGNYLWFEMKIRREVRADGGLLDIVTAADITQRRRAEVALEHQNAFIEELFDTDPNLIYVRDGNGHMIYCNQAVIDLVGKSRKELLADGVNMFPVTKDKIEQYKRMEREVIDEGKELMIEEKIPDKHGIINYFQTIKKSLKMKDGGAMLLNISTNINKIKYFQQETRRAMEAQEDFFSAMSHEIRTPLNAVIGIADLLLKRNPRNDQLKLVRTLDFSAKNLMGLINDVLDFSKIRAGKIEVEEINFNLKDLLGNIKLSLSQLAANKGISMELAMADDLPELVKGDYVKLSQILNNLLGNALKFTEKGSVKLKVVMVEESDGQYFLSFSVKDTGIGIPADKLPQIFEPFHQAGRETHRKFGGTGLGLSIVKNLIELQGGNIRVESKENIGTTMTFELPFFKVDKDKPVQALHIAHIKDVKWKMKLNVLYVEDVATNQYLIEEILSDWGIRVDMVSSGEDALDKVNSCIYDMILMDIQMPGMDGFETTRKIRSKKGNYFKEVPIIAMTASTSGSTKEKVFKSGMQDLVSKPISADDLRSRMIQHIKMADHPVEEEQTEVVWDEAIQGDSGTKVNFERTDKLFLENVVRYQEFLRMSIEELSINLDLLLTAIAEEDLVVFRKINHRMKNLLGTLSLHDLLEHLEKTKRKIADDQLSKKVRREMAISLRKHIEEVIDIMSHKQASLKWQ